jgi:hypothetical protein
VRCSAVAVAVRVLCSAVAVAVRVLCSAVAVAVRVLCSAVAVAVRVLCCGWRGAVVVLSRSWQRCASNRRGAGAVRCRGRGLRCIDILPALKREDSHGTAPLGWDV